LNHSTLSFLTLGIGTLAFGLLVGSLSARVAKRGTQSRSLGRKSFHVAVFTGAVPAQLWLGFWGVVLYGVVLALLVGQAVLRRSASSLFGALAREGDGEERATLVLLPLVMTALGGLLGVLLVGRFAVVGYLVCGWGDGAGEVVGGRWGRKTYSPPLSRGRGPSRTLEGSLAVLGAGSLGGWAALGLLGHPPLSALGIGFVAGLVGAVSEALSGRGTDNLWVQLLPSLTAWWFLG
jgi:dolichol kinase